MDDAHRSRQRLAAIALPITAGLYIAAEATNPKGTDQVVTTTATALRVLPIAAKHSSQLFLSGSLSELALGGVVVSYAALAMLVRRRGSTAATIAAALGGVGAFMGAVVNVMVGLNLAAAATAHVTRQAAAQILISNFNSTPGQIFTDLYGLSEYVAPVVMGIALWRSGRVSRWVAVLFAVGFEMAEMTGSFGAVKVLLLMTPFAVVSVLLAASVWRAADEMEIDAA